MKREIKFRGQLHEDEKTWIYGFLAHFVDECQHMIIIDASGADFQIMRDTVGQYIGLHDKQDSEIYEGDILLNDNGTKYVVEWLEQLAAFYLRIPNTHRGKEVVSCAASKVEDNPIMLYKMEVIGNIHDNPELIAA